MLLAHAQNLQAKGSWRAASTCCTDASIHPCVLGSASVQCDNHGWIHEVLEGMIIASSPCYDMKYHVTPSINPLGKWFGAVTDLLLPSWPFIPPNLSFLLIIDVLSQCLLTPSLMIFMEQLHQKHLSSARFPFFPLSYIQPYSFAHKEENDLALLLEGVGEQAFVATTKPLPQLLWGYIIWGASPFPAQQTPLKTMMYSV